MFELFFPRKWILTSKIFIWETEEKKSSNADPSMLHPNTILPTGLKCTDSLTKVCEPNDSCFNIRSNIYQKTSPYLVYLGNVLIKTFLAVFFSYFLLFFCLVLFVLLTYAMIFQIFFFDSFILFS